MFLPANYIHLCSLLSQLCIFVQQQQQQQLCIFVFFLNNFNCSISNFVCAMLQKLLWCEYSSVFELNWVEIYNSLAGRPFFPLLWDSNELTSALFFSECTKSPLTSILQTSSGWVLPVTCSIPPEITGGTRDNLLVTLANHAFRGK